jgi:hypothetical protein
MQQKLSKQQGNEETQDKSSFILRTMESLWATRSKNDVIGIHYNFIGSSIPTILYGWRDARRALHT